MGIHNEIAIAELKLRLDSYKKGDPITNEIIELVQSLRSEVESMDELQIVHQEEDTGDKDTIYIGIPNPESDNDYKSGKEEGSSQ